jgi:hypothetical protein
MLQAPSPTRVVVDEAMQRLTQTTTDYLHEPSDERAEEYARAIVALRIALEVLANEGRQP